MVKRRNLSVTMRVIFLGIFCLAWTFTAAAEAGEARLQGNGLTVTDRQTNLMWAKHGNLPGKPLSWHDANEFVKKLNDRQYGSYRDWRLPTEEELLSLIEFGEKKGVKRDFQEFFNKEGFTDVQAGDYWSATVSSDNSAQAFFYAMHCGGPAYDLKTKSLFLWPVRTAGAGGN